VIALRGEQPTWGKRRLADELAQAKGWVPLVSPGTVKRILRAAGLWPESALPAKRGVRAVPIARPTHPAKPAM
jgi:hypothetical protein